MDLGFVVLASVATLATAYVIVTAGPWRLQTDRVGRLESLRALYMRIYMIPGTGIVGTAALWLQAFESSRDPLNDSEGLLVLGLVLLFTLATAVRRQNRGY